MAEDAVVLSCAVWSI